MNLFSHHGFVEGSVMAPPSHHQQGASDPVTGSWEEYRIHVVESLGRIDDTLEKLWQALSEVKRDVTSLKIKVAMWSAGFGFAGASVPIIVDAVLRWKEIGLK
jgi:hypothetical protein